MFARGRPFADLRTHLARWLAAILCCAPAASIACPSPPLHIVLGYPPGGASDAVAKILAPELSHRLGFEVAISYSPGFGGAQGARQVSEAPPDGCMLFLGTLSTHALLPATARNLGYDPLSSFTPVSLAAAAPLIVAVHPSLPIRNVSELIQYARANPGRLRYGSSGVGTASHLAATMLARMTSVRMEHVPYDGSAPMINDLIAGRLHLSFDNAVAQAVREGRLRAIAVTSISRLAMVPSVPTLSEAGVPGYEASTWFGLYGPPRMPQALVQRIADAVSKILAQPAVRQAYAQQGLHPRYLGPAQFASFTQAETVRWAKEIEQTFGRGQ
jgi:tripartite-type tricarboxylate transporter receptor subunit TctC